MTKPTFYEFFDANMDFFAAMCAAFGSRSQPSSELRARYFQVVSRVAPRLMQDGENWCPVHDWQEKTSREAQRLLAAELGF